MEALCLQQGQTGADSRGDAYQLCYGLEERGWERDGERGKGEGERVRGRRGTATRNAEFKKKNVSNNKDIRKLVLVSGLGFCC